MQKWFAKAPEPLPEDEKSPTRIVTLQVDGKQTLAGTAEVCNLVGTGILEKTGEGTMKIADMGGFSGTVNVVAGTLAISGADAPVVPEFDPTGLSYWAEGNSGVSATTIKNGSTWVTQWDSKLADGWSAVTKYGTGAIPNEIDFSLKANTWMDMPINNALRFQKDGVDTRLDGIKSIFWVLGSQRGGGYLMGGGGMIDGAKLGFAWHRGQYKVNGTVVATGETNLCAILHGDAGGAEQRTAAWRINGAAVNPTADHLSGGWDVVSMVVADDTSTCAADGFAFDGRDSRDCGSQALGEVLVYNRRLADPERTALETYLACKYGFLHEAATNAAICLAAGTTLDCGSALQHLGGLFGAGTVVGDISADNLVADGAASAVPTVYGTYAVAARTAVEVRNVTPSDAVQEIVILRADAFRGTENLPSCRIAVPPELADNDNYSIRLKVRNGVLILRVSPNGSRIILR